jgi:hypothetical protein
MIERLPPLEIVFQAGENLEWKVLQGDELLAEFANEDSCEDFIVHLTNQGICDNLD